MQLKKQPPVAHLWFSSDGRTDFLDIRGFRTLRLFLFSVHFLICGLLDCPPLSEGCFPDFLSGKFPIIINVSSKVDYDLCDRVSIIIGGSLIMINLIITIITVQTFIQRFVVYDSRIHSSRIWSGFSKTAFGKVNADCPVFCLIRFNPCW